MNAFTKHSGLVAAMDRSNVDTDQIIPKQFLKRIERTGFGEYLFYDWRFDEAGNTKADFELNQPRFQGASILVARQNFGNGSSCLLYTSPSPRDKRQSRMPSSA